MPEDACEAWGSQAVAKAAFTCCNFRGSSLDVGKERWQRRLELQSARALRLAVSVSCNAHHR